MAFDDADGVHTVKRSLTRPTQRSDSSTYLAYLLRCDILELYIYLMVQVDLSIGSLRYFSSNDRYILTEFGPFEPFHYFDICIQNVLVLSVLSIRCYALSGRAFYPLKMR